MEIQFYDYNKENLEKVYSEYVEKIKEDHSLEFCTNMLCMVHYKKPKLNRGGAIKYVKTDYKIMTSTILIEWYEHEHINQIEFFPQNVCDIIKFAKMEDIDWNNI